MGGTRKNTETTEGENLVYFDQVDFHLQKEDMEKKWHFMSYVLTQFFQESS